jgi:hypothetical protein
MRAQPVVFTWDGATMTPVARYARAAREQFGEPGSTHILAPYEERNMKFHNMCFAALHEAWVNLPEGVAARWPQGAEHFRKWLLCNKSTFYRETEAVFPTREAALHAAVFARQGDEDYVFVYGPRPTTDGQWLVIKRTPRSQAQHRMSPREFEESMTQILDAAGEFIGVPKGALLKNAGRAA